MLLVENLGESQVNSPLEKKNSPLKNLYSGRYVLYSCPKIYLLFTLPVPSTVLKFQWQIFYQWEIDFSGQWRIHRPGVDIRYILSGNHIYINIQILVYKLDLIDMHSRLIQRAYIIDKMILSVQREPDSPIHCILYSVQYTQ